MSRIGKKIITIPEGVNVEMAGQLFSCQGQLGKLEIQLPPKIELKKEENTIALDRKNNDKETRALHGTFRQLVSNSLQGVSKGFEKTLEVIGVGFRVAMEGNQVVLNLGFSHQVKVNIPEDLKVKIEKNKIIISGIDKQRVGQFAAEIRALKKPEPYKGKGIRYSDEIIKRKAGKTSKK